MEQRVNFPTLTIVTPLNVRTSFSGPNSAMYLLEIIEGGGEGEKGREGEQGREGDDDVVQQQSKRKANKSTTVAAYATNVYRGPCRTTTKRKQDASRLPSLN